MKVLVAVKRVVDYNVKVHALPDGSGLDIDKKPMVKRSMNPFDEIAVEASVQLKEAGKADEVVAVTIGDAKAVDTLRVALAMGADRGIHVKTDAALEPLAVARILAAVIGKENPDVIAFGKQAIDDDAAQTGGAEFQGHGKAVLDGGIVALDAFQLRFQVGVVQLCGEPALIHILIHK